MVAPTYQTYEQVSSPYEKGSKLYVDIKHPNTGRVRQARWYEQKEWDKLYGNKKAAAADDSLLDTDGTHLGPHLNQKRVRGFSKGYVTLLKGTAADEEFFKSSYSCWHAVDLGWYVPSQLEVPSDLPATVRTAQLAWEEFHGPQGDEYRKPLSEIEKTVKKKFAST